MWKKLIPRLLRRRGGCGAEPFAGAKRGRGGANRRLKFDSRLGLVRAIRARRVGKSSKTGGTFSNRWGYLQHLRKWVRTCLYLRRGGLGSRVGASETNASDSDCPAISSAFFIGLVNCADWTFFGAGFCGVEARKGRSGVRNAGKRSGTISQIGTISASKFPLLFLPASKSCQQLSVDLASNSYGGARTNVPFTGNFLLSIARGRFPH